MPIYVYECNKCEDVHEEFHGMMVDPSVVCPKCSSKCSRLIQQVEVLVKGNCYLNKKDCKKAAELSTLQESDPYGTHRLPGEKEDLATKLKNKDKHRMTMAVTDPHNKVPKKSKTKKKRT